MISVSSLVKPKRSAAAWIKLPCNRTLSMSKTIILLWLPVHLLQREFDLFAHHRGGFSFLAAALHQKY
jgi:hypothetical protein